MVQAAISELSRISRQLTDDLDDAQLKAATASIDAIAHPLDPDDIRALMALLPSTGDTACGLNWSILHAIEAAPDWPLWDTLDDAQSEWIRIFRIRLANAGIQPPVQR